MSNADYIQGQIDATEAWISKLANKRNCKSAAIYMRGQFMRWEQKRGNRKGELQQGEHGNGMGAFLRRVMRRALVGAVIVSIAVAMAHMFANAAVQQAEFNRKVACEQAGQKINEWARKNGEVPPCRT
jgi:hypothetical protein